MKESSVLAKKYVPNNLREVNHWPLTNPFVAITPAEAPRRVSAPAPPRPVLVPPVPCQCLDGVVAVPKPSAAATPAPTQRSHVVCAPFRHILPNDNYYGVHWAGRKPSVIQIVKADDISDLKRYCFVWEFILNKEREEVLLRYENYSHYAVSLKISNLASVRHHDDDGEHGPGQRCLQATFSCHGIADANPPLMIGDTVLIRPLHRLSLPLMYKHEFPPPKMPPPPVEPPKLQPLPVPATPAQKRLHTLRKKEFSDYHKALDMHLRDQDYAQKTVVRQHERQQAQLQLLDSIMQTWEQEHPTKQQTIRQILDSLQWSPPERVVEIQSKILLLSRSLNPTANNGRKGHADQVIFSWLDNMTANILSYTSSAAAKANINHAELYNIRFVPSKVGMKRFLTALDWLAESFADAPGKAMELLFPVSAPNVPISSSEALANDILARSYKLNDRQAEFVSMVLGRTKRPSMNEIRGPMICTGPAGTGKTLALLSAIRAVLSLNNNNKNGANGNSGKVRHRILVCTPSHTAADVVTRRLGQHMKRDELFRLFDADRPVTTVPVEVLGFCRQSEDQLAAFTMPDAQSLINFQVIVCTCSDAHLLYQIGLTNQQLRERRYCLRTYIKKTCDVVNLDFELHGVDDPHFTHLFIDEAAQASEPEILVPLSVVVDPLGKRKVEIALCGDPRQLSPAVYSEHAADAGLQRSWMERLLQRPVRCLGGGQHHMLGPDMVEMDDWLKYSFRQNGQEQLSIFLTLNYRGHPSFLMMPSVLFYADKLQSSPQELSKVELWCEKLRSVESLSSIVCNIGGGSNTYVGPPELQCIKQRDWPLHFRGVKGKDTSVTIESGFASSSWANEKEARAVLEIIMKLVEQGVSSQSIGVMAPFQGQVVLIRKLLRSNRLGAVNVGTVEDYQAVEHDVIVLSLTRSTSSFVHHDVMHRMGVFGQPKRSNVAMTRADFLFIVVSTSLIFFS